MILCIMINFLSFPEQTRRELIDTVSTASGIAQNAIEKDWWVTLVLKALFSLPMSEHFIFKGGTSLSKGWGLIKRFSEDVDIALAPDAFGKTYKTDASRTYVKNLKKRGCEYTSTVIARALHERLLEMGVPADMITMEVEAVNPGIPDKDPQTIYIHYNPLFEASAYMLPRVKIEFGVRSLREPFAEVEISSVLASEGNFPGYKETPFKVLAVDARKTFMEKMILLHEKFETGALDDLNAERQSRHLSDLGGMTLQGISDIVMTDGELYSTLIEHRRVYTGIQKVDYNRMGLHQLKFIPPHSLMPAFRDDYRVMEEQMLYGTPPDFDTVIGTLRQLNGRTVTHGLDCNIDELTKAAIQKAGTFDGTQGVIITTITWPLDDQGTEPVGPGIATFEFEIISVNGMPAVHRITRIA